MAFYDPFKETSLTVDASLVGLGAILTQTHKDGTTHNISYASRSLTDTERRYSQTETEALAVVWVCDKFHLYLVGKRFLLYTDHKPLEMIYNPKSKPPPRIERWLLGMQQYHYRVEYHQAHPTQLMICHVNHFQPTDCALTLLTSTPIHRHAISKSMTLKEIVDATNQDHELQLKSRHRSCAH